MRVRDLSQKLTLFAIVLSALTSVRAFAYFCRNSPTHDSGSMSVCDGHNRDEQHKQFGTDGIFRVKYLLKEGMRRPDAPNFPGLLDLHVAGQDACQQGQGYAQKIALRDCGWKFGKDNCQVVGAVSERKARVGRGDYVGTKGALLYYCETTVEVRPYQGAPLIRSED